MKIFRVSLFILPIVAVCLSCSSGNDNTSVRMWAGHSIDLKHIMNEKDSFIMFNPKGEKVGGMVWNKTIANDKYVHKDISYFDDGSVYEEASFFYSLNPLSSDSIQISMQVPTAALDINYSIDGKNVKGTYVISRDSTERLINLDSLYNYDILRPEIYSLIHSLNFDSVTQFPIKVFSPEGMSVADAEITYLGREIVDEGYGKFDCLKVELKGGGIIPDNILWINEEPRRIVRVYVPEPELNIVLVHFSN
ncbi:MAG: hypothetical protein ABJH04_16825 [Cyclobacteriaceae bacterium]